MPISSVVTILTVVPQNAGGDFETRSLCRDLKVFPVFQVGQSPKLPEAAVGTRPPSKIGLWYIPAPFRFAGGGARWESKLNGRRLLHRDLASAGTGYHTG